MKLTRVGIDLAKNVFQIHGVDEHGLTDRFRSWLHELWNELLRLDQRCKALDAEIEHISNTHPNVAAVALANKTVRIAWVMLRHGTDFDPELAVA